MRLLLDTHVLIWWWTDRSLLPDRIDRMIESGADQIFVSSVNACEIATKARIGKLPQLLPYLDRYEAAVADADFRSLDLKAAHGLRAGAYDVPHRDPFDRMLAAQAELEGLILLTRDPAFSAFPCETLWHQPLLSEQRLAYRG
ncbi:type II toxin-antitoxin system VapC family toxin [Sphingobium sp. WCS2017Hpa-17]|uniref:type II toxin-antitoxin system VapC family toxin n=1 Tax=Sphingobium sp. WCS2017Hpa-17 TaxID=3073638 RepID=UPI00288A9852|nr:type II toxin-antitoxin system VapC family toxin [Sphingobium sp. WCS2017Hpa-17]